jgi:hypothetical protein
MRSARLFASLLLCSVLIPAAELATWPVDALIKVFPQDAPGANRAPGSTWLVARNGHATVQFAIRSADRIKALNVKVTAAPGIECQVRHVGYVPVDSNAPDVPVDELLRLAPAFFPDPLYEQFPYTLHANRTEAIWVTVYAPATTTPGVYAGRVVFESGEQKLAEERFEVKVTAARVPAQQTLKVTNWFRGDAALLARHYKLQGEDEHYWKLMANTARVMADHRQNVFLTPVKALAEPRVEGGKLRYDFSRLDRWVDTFEKAGMRTIEGGHLLTRRSGYHSPMCVPADVLENGKVVRTMLDPGDGRAEPFLETFLDALYAHLREKGWEKRYFQHVHDEPHGNEREVYRRYALLIRRHLPGIPTMDAVGLNQDVGFLNGAVDVWVPVLGSFDKQLEKIQAHVAAGGQAWFYTCNQPQRRHLNRFIDLPLVKTRLLHWFNYRYGLTGYLHWGGNYWSPAPFDNVQPIINNGATLLPAGDGAVVYPWAERYSIHSSIRLEAMRDGIEDYELLNALAKRDPERVRRLAAQAVPHFTDYVREVNAFRRLQAQLLEP